MSFVLTEDQQMLRDTAEAFARDELPLTHFRTLRAVLGEWSRDEIADPPETWAAFRDRVRAAVAFAAREGMEVAL